MSDQHKEIAALLAKLKQQGATIKSNVKEGSDHPGTALTEETLNNLSANAGPFDAWVSWSKSF
jgi:hypothetical protein